MFVPGSSSSSPFVRAMPSASIAMMIAFALYLILVWILTAATAPQLFHTAWTRRVKPLTTLQPLIHLSVKYEEPVKLDDGKRRRDAVRDAFRHAYRGYERHAFGHDELRPCTNQTNDSWGGFAATMVDALDTMAIMGLKNELSRAVEFVRTIDFDKDYGVSFFETTIRYLGGLLSAHSMTGHGAFLEKATELGDRLVRAFDASPSGMPKSILNLRTGASRNHNWNGGLSILAEVGSSQLEFAYLSHHTRNPTYAEKSRRVFRVLERQVKALHPGLYNVYIDPKTGAFGGEQRLTVGSLADSFYEYLLKLYIITGGRDTDALRMFNTAARGIRKHLVHYEAGQSPETAKFAYIGEVVGLSHMLLVQEHLTCFMPGLFALAAMVPIDSGKTSLHPAERELLANRVSNLRLAKQLARGCVKTYTDMPTGLGPESIDFSRLVADTLKPESHVRVVQGKYMLRPETVESLFMLWRATGEQQWRDAGWKIFQAIEMHCKTPAAFSGIRDVAHLPENAESNWDNSMQSFFFSETLKYLYLLFSDDSVLPLDKFVFTTEAHPLRIIASPSTAMS